MEDDCREAGCHVSGLAFIMFNNGSTLLDNLIDVRFTFGGNIYLFLLLFTTILAGDSDVRTWK